MFRCFYNQNTETGVIKPCIPEGARTSEYYRVTDIPDRFEHPGKCFYTFTKY